MPLFVHYSPSWGGRTGLCYDPGRPLARERFGHVCRTSGHANWAGLGNGGVAKRGDVGPDSLIRRGEDGEWATVKEIEITII